MVGRSSAAIPQIVLHVVGALLAVCSCLSCHTPEHALTVGVWKGAHSGLLGQGAVPNAFNLHVYAESATTSAVCDAEQIGAGGIVVETDRVWPGAECQKGS